MTDSRKVPPVPKNITRAADISELRAEIATLAGEATLRAFTNLDELHSIFESPIEQLMSLGIVIAQMAEHRSVALHGSSDPVTWVLETPSRPPRGHSRNLSFDLADHPIVIFGAGTPTVHVVAQCWFANRRLDLLIEHPPYGRIAVECDGHAYHERTKEQAKRDRSRDRWMLDAGLDVMRFTGSEIFLDAVGCGAEVRDFLLGAQERSRTRMA